MTQDVLKHFGKVDILVNNAGRSQDALVEKTSLEVDRAFFDFNGGWEWRILVPLPTPECLSRGEDHRNDDILFIGCHV